MQKKVENHGEYVEVGYEDILWNFDKLEESEIFTLVNGRLEFAGPEREDFLSRFSRFRDSLSQAGALKGMDDSQASFFIIKRMLMRDGMLSRVEG